MGVVSGTLEFGRMIERGQTMDGGVCTAQGQGWLLHAWNRQLSL